MIRPYRPRAAITGIGVLAANGIGKDAFWQSILDRKSGIGPITRFDSSDMDCHVAGEITDFDPRTHVGKGLKPRRYALHTQFVLAAFKLALEDAGLTPRDESFRQPVPLALGVSTSAFELIEQGMTQLLKRGPGGVSPFLVSASPPQSATSAITELFGIPTVGITVSTGCPSGLDAVAAAAEAIRSDQHELTIAGGTDAPVTQLAFSTFLTAGLASMSTRTPEETSRPFDRDRDSGVIAEGAGILVLENMDAALARGAEPYARITGYATQLDEAGEEPGTGLKHTMKKALANAGRRPREVDWICAHGPGHPVLDRVETAMVKEVFGRDAYRLPVSSIKGVLGNPLAAAGPLQIAAAALAFRSGLIPPTANLETPDTGCDLDYVPEGPRFTELECVLVNIHGIGGTNSSLVLERSG